MPRNARGTACGASASPWLTKRPVGKRLELTMMNRITRAVAWMTTTLSAS